MSLNRITPPPVRPMNRPDLARPERRMMKNGMMLNILNVGDEDVVRVDILIGAGSWHQTQPLQAMFANRMLREGTDSMNTAQIAERLDFYGAYLELSSTVNYGFITLYSLNKYFEQTWAVVTDILLHPTFPEKELAVVSEVNKQRFWVNSTKVEVIARKNFNRSLFGPRHPLGRYAVESDYDRLSSPTLRDFYRRYYHSGNSTVYVSGKVTPAITACIERTLGAAPWGSGEEIPTLPHCEAQPMNGGRVFVEKEDALQSSLKMGGFLMDALHPDFLKTRVLVTILGGYFGSRLMTNIREEKGYTYGIGAGIATYPGNGVLVVSTEADNRYVDAIVREVYTEMERLCNDLVPQAELDMVKNYMLGEWCRTYEGPFSLAEAWIYVQTAGVDDEYIFRSAEAVKTVTSEEIRHLAQTYFCKENLIEVVAGKKV